MFDFFSTSTRNVGALFYTATRSFMSVYKSTSRRATLYRYKTTYDFYIDTKRQCATWCVNRMPPPRRRNVSFCIDFAMTYDMKLAPGEKFTRGANLFGNESPGYFPGETIPYISLANIAARGYGTPGMHAYFSAKSGSGGGGTKFRSASRANATFYYERRRRARARSVEPKRPSASIFCPRQRFFSVSHSPPPIPRRSSFTGAGNVPMH